MRVRVFYHDKCFDGACSASLFTRFHRERIDAGASYEYHGLVHRAGALFDESDFTGDENAIVDFKYSASPRITWWFDHHQSAFLTAQDQANFRACQEDPACASRKFFDPTYVSCTGFLAHIASTRFGFDTAPVAELIHWANIVDGALYESPEAAVEMAAASDEADAGHRVQPGSAVCSPAHSAFDGDASGRRFEPALCGGSSAAAAGASQAGSGTDPRSQPKNATAPSSSISPTIRWRDSTSSSPTTCIRKRLIPSGCRSRASVRRWPSGPTHGPRPIRRRW